jgi:DNA (cytosine-5)-methyltransferase 1
MELKVLELFGGIGACSKALERIGIDYEIADYVEIDKYAVASFNAIHNTNFEPQDICEWDKDIEVDLIMHGSPCQDFSLAGKQAGGDEGSGTRSSLMYETIRIVEKLKPKYVIWENVKNLLSKKHRHNFDAYLETMEQLGYTNYYQVLNSKDYGIPQNRERVFTISILGNEKYVFPLKEELKTSMHNLLEENVEEKYFLSENMKKYVLEKNEKSNFKVFRPHYAGEEKIAHTIQTSGGNRADDNFIVFQFPPKQELKLKLKDMLEDEVDEKYYLSDKMIKYISATGTANFKNPDCKINLDVARPLTTDQNKRAGTTNYLSDELPDNYDLNLKSKQKQLISLIEKTEFVEGKVLNMDLYNQTTNENISQCLTEPHHNSQRLFDGVRIRKLTPKECWRLMGFDDADFEKAAKVNSNTQLYKQAGNSIVVNVLEAILSNLLKIK